MRFLKRGSFFNYTKYFEYDEKMSQNEISIMIQIEFLLRQSNNMLACLDLSRATIKGIPCDVEYNDAKHNALPQTSRA